MSISEKTDIVERLRDGIPTQSCDVRSDVWVRCGRGDCACERQLMISAAIEIARLRALSLHEDGGRDELLALAKFILGGIQRKKLMDQTILRRNGEEIETEALSTKIAGVIARAEAAAPPAPVQEDNPIIEAARRWQRLMHDAGRERQLTASESGLLANLKAALVAEKDGTK